MKLKLLNNIKIAANSSLTIASFNGQVTYGNLIDFFMFFYLDDNFTQNLMLDGSLVTGERVSSQDIRRLLFHFHKTSEKRLYGKTAIIASSSLDMTLGRIAINLADDYRFPIQINNFYNLNSALQWIGINTPIPEQLTAEAL